MLSQPTIEMECAVLCSTIHTVTVHSVKQGAVIYCLEPHRQPAYCSYTTINKKCEVKARRPKIRNSNLNLECKVLRFSDEMSAQTNVSQLKWLQRLVRQFKLILRIFSSEIHFVIFQIFFSYIEYQKLYMIQNTNIPLRITNYLTW